MSFSRLAAPTGPPMYHTAPPVRTANVAGHFGEFLQGRLGPEGPVALVTLPCPVLQVQAAWRPGRRFGLWQGAAPVLSRAHLVRLGRIAGVPMHGQWRLRATMPPGGGAGASTAALLAALRCLDRGLSPEQEAALCHAVEGASDPLMHPAPAHLLWAPRAARSLGDLPPLPAFEVLGGFAGPGPRTDPADLRFAEIGDLVAHWRTAPGRTGLADLSSESARRNHALRGGADPAPVLATGRAMGALGLAAAHTGTALALLFAPGTVPDGASAALRRLGLACVTRFRIGGGA